MELQCEQCPKRFPSNASLYKHKQIAHHKPSLILVNHTHKKMDPISPFNDQEPRKRPRDDSSDTEQKPSKEPRVDPQFDDGLIVVDEYNDPGTNLTDSDPKPRPQPRNINLKRRKKFDYNPITKSKKIVDRSDYRITPADPQLDDGLTIIDSYNDPGVTPSNSDPKPKPSDGSVQIIDKSTPDSDDKSDGGYAVVDSYYKKKYEECLESHKNLSLKYKKDIENLKNDRNDTLEKLRHELEDECQAKIKDLNKLHKQDRLALEDKLEDQYGEKIRSIKQLHDKEIDDMKFSHRKEIADYERDCHNKIMALNEQIEAMDNDDVDATTLSDAIFNCTSMSEIFKIQRLITNHQFDEIIENHLRTLQNLFLSLSYGVLPICQPQRDQVTNDQRRLVEKVQTASKTTAKKLLRDNRADVVNLFTIIKDSLKLARDTYNRYGTLS